MAQTQSQQQPPSQSFSPPGSNPSPNPSSPADGIAPPAKRPRLSPLPQAQQPLTPQQSFASPSFGTLQLPKVGSPVNGIPTNGMSNPPSNPPPAPPGSMAPPPSRPAEKARIDAAELTDVLASSGIDVGEEDAFLTQGYGQAATGPPSQPPRLQTAFNNSFTSQGSAGTVSAGNSFTEQPPPRPTPYQPYHPPPANVPPPQPERTPEEIAEDARLRRNTAASRRAQHHLQAPFLNTAAVESRLDERTDDVGIKLPTQGVYRPVPDQPPITVDVTGPDGSSVVRTGRTIMDHSATLGDIISLVSLACEERLRSVIDHSAALAQNRRLNSNGVVPEEWVDVAATEDTTGENKTNGGKDRKSPVENGKKRSISAVDEPSESNARKSIKLPNHLALQSHRVVDKDLVYEESREARRLKRNSDAIVAGGDGKTGSVSTPGPATPSGERASEGERKTTKKEQKKADSEMSDAARHQESVKTARMQTGNLASRFGGKKKKYSWLTPSAPSGSRPGLSTPSKPNMPATAGTSGPSGGSSSRARGSRLGEWREDDKRAAGIQIKDILFMLEVDGTASKHIQKGYSKQTKEELDRPSN